MDSNLDVIFLGGLFPKETEAEILRHTKGAIQNAANIFHMSGIKK